MLQLTRGSTYSVTTTAIAQEILTNSSSALNSLSTKICVCVCVCMHAPILGTNFSSIKVCSSFRSDSFPCPQFIRPSSTSFVSSRWMNENNGGHWRRYNNEMIIIIIIIVNIPRIQLHSACMHACMKYNFRSAKVCRFSFFISVLKLCFCFMIFFRPSYVTYFILARYVCPYTYCIHVAPVLEQDIFSDNIRYIAQKRTD